MIYAVRTESESFTLSSKDFQGLTFASYVTDQGSAEIGCNANVAAFKAVLSYRPKTVAKNPSRGEMVSIEFVPADFRFMDTSVDTAAVVVAIDPSERSDIESDDPPVIDPREDYNTQRRNAMMDHIKESLRKPML